jgi:hypothetical protein
MLDEKNAARSSGFRRRDVTAVLPPAVQPATAQPFFAPRISAGFTEAGYSMRAVAGIGDPGALAHTA